MDAADNAILAKIDYTLLAQNSTPAQIRQLCAEAARFGFASVCVPTCYVETALAALAELGSAVPVCAVAGFPFGYNTTECKLYETRQALDQGAEEVDMVINVGRLLAGDEDYVYNEIRLLKQETGGKVLKVIIEACLLDERRKIIACGLVTRAGADFIKTSTGFSTGGATVEDIRLLRANVGPGVKVKAAGGIRSAEFARALVAAGADRLGMSAAVKAFGLA
ncbi:MAG: deoxyribose-phosphate aldolase [Oscillospiraceae bacterium]|jgi:deoxyribose-phosphate aldolase|nr:deoxyribose-phosphate aldolase [Oscillospiraceae bacterium]